MSPKEWVITTILFYYMAISIYAVYLTISDKKKAQNDAWRVPERKLMVVGLLGGALPMLITMKKIRHKTKHKKFMVGLPAEIVLHLVLIFTILKYFN